MRKRQALFDSIECPSRAKWLASEEPQDPAALVMRKFMNEDYTLSLAFRNEDDAFSIEPLM
jgi:hypothetical protein